MRPVSVIALLSLLLFACKRSEPIDKPAESQPRQKFLTRMTVTDLGSDKVNFIAEWKYDNSNRCTDLIESQLFPNGNGGMVFSTAAHYRYYYYNAEKNPYRILQDQDGKPNELRSDAYLFYAANGQKIKDSVIYTDPAADKLLKTGTYQYNNNLVHYHLLYTILGWPGAPGNTTIEKDDTVFLVNGNAEQYRISSQEVDLNGNPVNRRIQFSYSYDNKINPFRQQNIATAMYQIGPDVNFNKWHWLYSEYANLNVVGYNSNNITRIVKNGSLPPAEQFTYVYDEDNYPKEAAISITTLVGTSRVTYDYKE